MLTEFLNVRQCCGEGKRRWFSDRRCDLIVWYDSWDQVTGFEFCFDKETCERFVRWQRGGGITSGSVDTGEIFGRSKSTPIMKATNLVSTAQARTFFDEASGGLDPAVRALVASVLS